MEEQDSARLRRWAASLRRTSCATREQALRHGPAWPYYQLSLDCAASQAAQSEEMDARAEALERSARAA